MPISNHFAQSSTRIGALDSTNEQAHSEHGTYTRESGTVASADKTPDKTPKE